MSSSSLGVTSSIGSDPVIPTDHRRYKYEQLAYLGTRNTVRILFTQSTSALPLSSPRRTKVQTGTPGARTKGWAALRTKTKKTKEGLRRHLRI